MPPALNVDWKAIQALYVAGIDATTLGNQFGVDRKAISKRSIRFGWQDERKRAEELKASILRPLASDHVSSLKPMNSGETVARVATSLMAEQKKRFLEAGGDVAMRGIELTRKHLGENDSLEHLANVGAVADSFVKVAKPIFGLNDTSAVQVGVQVNVLSELPADDLCDAIEIRPV
jgi:hypothetical protein